MNKWMRQTGIKKTNYRNLTAIFKPLFTPNGHHTITHVFSVANFRILRQIYLPVGFQCSTSIVGMNSWTSESELRVNCDEVGYGVNNEYLIALCKKGRLKEAVDILHETCIWADLNTYSFLLRECAIMNVLEEGKRVHAHITSSGFQPNIWLENNILDMYVKCGNVMDARSVFDQMSQRNNISWNAMISAYTQQGHDKVALKHFCQMLRKGMKPDPFTFSSVLRACAGLAAIQPGKEVHAHLIKIGFEVNIFVGSALVDMYAKCGFTQDARHVFDKIPTIDVVLWTTMIVGYAQNEDDEEALKLFSQMQLTDVKPNQYTFSSAFSACASLAALEQGQQIHSNLIKTGFVSYDSVQTGLVSMYAKCGVLESAWKVFDKMGGQCTMSWTTIIAGYAQNGHGEKAMALFCEMQRAGMKPSQYTFTGALSACSSLPALEQGKQVHSQILKTGFQRSIFVGSALVDMYGKCGSMDDACVAFDKIHTRDIVLWNSMIAGYAQNGFSKEALQVFEEMQQSGMKPDHITFIGVLSACSHGGLLSEGHYFFDSMSQDHGISPTAGHYACMVDLLGRAGCLAQAENLICSMPLKPDAVMWGTLLGACKVYGNVEIGKRAADRLFELEPEDVTTYILLSNIYAAAGRWDDVAKVRNMIADRGLKKEPGLSWIEVKGKVHAFIVGDRSHPQTEEIYAELDRLTRQMKEACDLPHTIFWVQDVKQEQKEYCIPLQ
eukprot:Gb_10151 [translate_table: standard]